MTTPRIVANPSRRRWLRTAAALLGAPLFGCQWGERQEQTPLNQKIGQMVMVGFRGLEVTAQDPIWEQIAARNLGGVVLYSYDVPSAGAVARNIASPEQLKRLTDTLHAIREEPLLIGIDQEGGKIRRLRPANGFPDTPSHQALGTRDDPAYTFDAARAIAATLREQRINLNFAPVVDVNVNPDNPIIARYERSFSADPQAVIRHARAYIAGHHEAGVLTTLKHFPGHGSSTGDSHLGVTDVTHTWQPLELDPYRALVAEGNVDLVMTAHVFHAGLDPDHPATLSRAVITDLLRGEIGFDGVVVSDDMQMGAIVQHYGFESALRLAIEAGVDLLVISNNNAEAGYDGEVAVRAIEAIAGMVARGEIPAERIDRSYRRLQRLKARLAQLEGR